MTRPSALVLDGSEVKLRLEAERAASGNFVHVDWLRFTVLRRNTRAPSADILFPPAQTTSIWDEGFRQARIQQILATLPDCDFDASAQALELAREVAEALGPDYSVPVEVRKGHDFYKFRWSIERNGSECGWIAYLSSSDSPRQQSQSRTIHCNLYGAACTFAAAGWNYRIANLIEARNGDITRCDLALDFFDGFDGGMAQVQADYMAGLMDVGGRRLKCSMLGDWCNGHERSFYFGSKQAGKQTNVYEKGDQLFGVDSASAWVRVELRYGNKLRVLSADMLRRPDDFFAGASDWHARYLRLVSDAASPARVVTTSRLPAETVAAEVVRNVRWFVNTAGPTVVAAFRFLADADFLTVVEAGKLPKRLQRFSPSELKAAFVGAMSKVSSVGGPCPAAA